MMWMDSLLISSNLPHRMAMAELDQVTELDSDGLRQNLTQKLDEQIIKKQ